MNKEIEIANEPSQKEVEDALLDATIPSMKRWLLISSLEGNRALKDAINEIKGGVKLAFDIRTVLKGYVEEEPHFEQVKIARKQIVNIHSYWDELEERDKIMKNIIRELIDDSFDSQIEEKIKGYD